MFESSVKKRGAGLILSRAKAKGKGNPDRENGTGG
jgi:hypothetical protein